MYKDYPCQRWQLGSMHESENCCVYCVSCFTASSTIRTPWSPRATNQFSVRSVPYVFVVAQAIILPFGGVDWPRACAPGMHAC